ncbi:MAG: zinc ribbon domain-containing protein [Proteobacteria bacterium]|nr:zinc ribbon domain-containing protein [Pseudomonadota bacterium]MBU1688968.1 zinc ribbon domain-containing protein [Pseudomonadota bacterium]
MPIYEFKCQDCKTIFEVLTTSSTDPLSPVCTKCGGAKVNKTISAASLRVSSGSTSIPAGALSGCSSRSGFS